MLRTFAVMGTSAEYIPGTCNIGAIELKERKNAMWFSLGIAIVAAMLLFAFGAPEAWRLVLFFPLSAFAVSFQQVYFRFCVNFGLRGIFNFGNPGAHDTVREAEFRRKDRRKAIQMIVSGILFGLLVTLLIYFLPV